MRHRTTMQLYESIVILSVRENVFRLYGTIDNKNWTMKNTHTAL